MKSIFLTSVILIASIWSLKSYSQDGYIMSYFGGPNYQEAMYLAYSYDGLNWIGLNNNNPVLRATLGNKSIRDPFIFRNLEGSFVIMSTDSWNSEYALFWDSEDLITFKNERLVRLNDMKQHVWAPECFIDSALQKYIVYWSGDIIYANTTSDFITFSKAEKFFDPGHICIDANIIKDKGTYYLIYKDERGENADTTKYKSLKVAKSKTLQAGSFITFTTDYIADHLVEGPACIKDLTKDKWYLYYDYFMQGGIWGCSYTNDFSAGKWTKMNSSEFSLPTGVRHGNATKVNALELNKIIDKWK
jgi:hypothetical protein